MFRLIARMDIKGKHLIKGVHLEGLRKVGSPQEYAQKYYQQGADELIYMDAVASLYERNSLTELIKDTVKSVFIPITVGGGIRTVEDATNVLRSGADKVAINTAAVRSPKLISEMAEKFGSQSVVISIEAKRTSPGQWEVYTDNGREKTGKDVLTWVKEAVTLGAGEVLLTSIDQEGTRKGLDQALITAVCQIVSVPVIASGGYHQVDDARQTYNNGASAVAIADALHYDRSTIPQIRDTCLTSQLPVRRISKEDANE